MINIQLQTIGLYTRTPNNELHCYRPNQIKSFDHFFIFHQIQM
jgi:hypothetical protein